MKAEEKLELEEVQRQKRKRINRMKNIIVATIAFWMLASLVAIVILSVCLGKLNQRVHVLEKALDTEVVEIKTDTEPDTEPTGTAQEDTETEQPSETETESENVNVDYTNVVRGIDTEDNMAAEGDTHYVYLTFDSTPGSNTEQILDVLDNYQLKATFFVAGDVSEDYYDTVRRIVDDGQTLGMRSFAGSYSTIYASTEAFESDFFQISDFLYELTGERCSLYRFPGGSGNEISNVDMAEFVHILNANEISYFDWNVSAGDAASDYSVEDVVNNVVEGVSQYKTSVVLLHDASDKSTTVEALASLIEALQGMDAQILPIDENTTRIQYIKADSVQ
jgi:peptidoglycan/xylan/chitin deacetylase (PgdA/CDA1 family)